MMSAALQPFEPGVTDIYSIETVAHLTQTPRHRIAVYCLHGLISPMTAPERDGWWFDHKAIRVLRRIEALRVDLDVKLAGLRVVAELVHEIEQLREKVRARHRF
jgi:DNA-binding transcriptional MerR regulator